MSTILSESIISITFTEQTESNVCQHFDSTNYTLSLNETSLEYITRIIRGKDEKFFQKVSALDISGCGLKEVPHFISKLVNLKCLIMKENQLTDIPSSVLEPLRFTLKELNLAGNKFNKIPHIVCQLPQLEKLHLSCNQLCQLPESLLLLTKLKVLYLSHNNLSLLPAHLFQLSNLEKLQLNYNQISNIPAEIKYLKSIRSIALDNNIIKALPAEVITLTNLTNISLKENPLARNGVKETILNKKLIGTQILSLKELAASFILKTLKQNGSNLHDFELPINLKSYLINGKKCMDHDCVNTYFHSHSEELAFVDFCGIYKLPLLLKLCPKSHENQNAHNIDKAWLKTKLSSLSIDDDVKLSYVE